MDRPEPIMLLKLPAMLKKSHYYAPIMPRAVPLCPQHASIIECSIRVYYYISECSIGVFYLSGDCSNRVYRSFLS